MGSHAITYAVVALAIAAVCLFAGFFWGRSNVKAQIEQAVEKEHIALDSREFAMRTQLEDAIAEIARLRPLAEELGRVQKRLEREQAKYAQMKAEFNASMGIAPDPSAQEDPDLETQAVPAESADDAIQKLLQSLEAFNAPEGDAPVPATEPEAPTPAPPLVPPAPLISRVPPIAQPAVIAQPPKPAELPRAVIPPQPLPQAPAPPRPATPAPIVAARSPIPSTPGKPIPAAAPASPAARSAPSVQSQPMADPPPKAGQQVDEWQEFARQLEALTGKKK